MVLRYLYPDATEIGCLLLGLCGDYLRRDGGEREEFICDLDVFSVPRFFGRHLLILAMDAFFLLVLNSALWRIPR